MKNYCNYITKKHGRFLHIYCPIYRENYYYINIKNISDIKKLLKSTFNVDKDIDEFAKGGFSIIKSDAVEIPLLWTLGKNLDTISHEAFHAACYTLRTRGIDLSESSEEAFAYLTQFIVGEIVRKRK